MPYITTISGDTWDTIALRAYDDETRCQELMQARENIQLLDIEIFPGGMSVFAPEIPGVTLYTNLPDWRR